MIIDTAPELEILSVLHRGEANEECIAIRVMQEVNIARYGLLIGYRHDESSPAVPYRDSFLWFGEANLNPNDWLFVFTGGGTPRVTRSSDNSGNLYVVHWGRPKTIFANSSIVPILIRIDGISIPPLRFDSDQLVLPSIDQTRPPLISSS